MQPPSTLRAVVDRIFRLVHMKVICPDSMDWMRCRPSSLFRNPWTAVQPIQKTLRLWVFIEQLAGRVVNLPSSLEERRLADSRRIGIANQFSRRNDSSPGWPVSRSIQSEMPISSSACSRVSPGS